jgi:FAD/FMN-containing dehydrogenase
LSLGLTGPSSDDASLDQDMSQALLSSLAEVVGATHVQTELVAHPDLVDYRGVYHGQALAIVHPGSTAEVAAVMKLCHASRTPVVVQGGNTGLLGAATPDGSGLAIVLKLNRMQRVRAIDPANDTITVEAGCVLQSVQEHAAAADRLFPLALGAQGSCTIGGNLATNAGGIQVLRYGNMRELTLGLEVVTAQGEVWHGLRGLRKDNTGYDLRDAFIGSEGTLGVITAATLKLFPKPVGCLTAMLRVASAEDAVKLFGLLRKRWGGSLTAFELFSGSVLGFVRRRLPGRPLPVPDLDEGSWYALVDYADFSGDPVQQTLFEQPLTEALESGLLTDATIAQNESQRQKWWHLREHGVMEAQATLGRNVKHDISLPISCIPDFLAQAQAQLNQRFPSLFIIAYGHLGDGNLHYNLIRPESLSLAEFIGWEDAIHELVHDLVHEFGGSISAEHGVGQGKRDALLRYKDPVELALMGRLKQAFDPEGILNPGKVLPARVWPGV